MAYLLNKGIEHVKVPFGPDDLGDFGMRKPKEFFEDDLPDSDDDELG